LELYENEWCRYFWDNIVLVFENKIDWCWLSSNSNINVNIIKENINKPWNWRSLSCNPNITLQFVKENLDKPWNWNLLMIHRNIDWFSLKTYFNKYNKQNQLSYYSQNTNNYSTCRLSELEFTKEKEMFMERKIRQHLAAFKIQVYWRRANKNPQYELCKRRFK
jgi:hypothetical protein